LAAVRRVDESWCEIPIAPGNARQVVFWEMMLGSDAPDRGALADFPVSIHARHQRMLPRTPFRTNCEITAAPELSFVRVGGDLL
jgi:hypothetical protein